MDAAVQRELRALGRQSAMNSVIDQFASPVQRFYCGATVFVTGGSGFLGKQLIEKLFRSTKIHKLYILIRPKKGKTAEERLVEVLKDPVFSTVRNLRADFVERIVPVEGDVSEIGLGIKHNDRIALIEQVNLIFHVAATIRFDEPLASSALVNVRGTREMLQLAKECKNLRCMVYVSTAYSHAMWSNPGERVLEQFYPCSMTPDLVIKLAETIDQENLDRITPELIRPWPNTYSFTKALSEELIRTSGADLPICVLRPSIVICTNCEPVPGWIDISSVFGPSGLTLGTTMGVIHVLPAKTDIKIDFVPADLANNAAIAAAWHTAGRWRAGARDATVFSVSSSARNCLTWGGLTRILENDVRPTFISPQAIWYTFAFQTTNRWLFNMLCFLLHHIPAIIMDSILALLKKPTRLQKIYSTYNKLSAVLKCYVTNDWIFDDTNTTELYNSLCERDKQIYNFDITTVDWTEQTVIWCIGLRRYIVKDGLKDTDLGRRRQRYYKIITYIICALLAYVLMLLIYYVFKCIRGVFIF